MPNQISESAALQKAQAAAEISTPMSFVARQPILDAQQKIFGYELLFRSGWENFFVGDSDNAIRQMIDTALFLGVDTLALGAKAFVNCSREALIGRLVTFLPPASTVLEILETVQIDDDVLQACIDLKHLGYQIALDDFLPGTSADRLLGIADYVKLDVRACAPDHLTKIQDHIQHQLSGTHPILLAEKVETSREFNRALADGYTYFQGYFFSRPSILASHEIPANRLVYIQLLSALSREPSNRDEIERLVMADASICFRLLRLVNSAGFGSRGRVSSIRQALIMVGDEEFRKLVTIAAATCFGKDASQSPELTLLCLHRARFCELLAPLAGQGTGEQYLIGLLSTVDAMLHIPMQQLIGMLPLRRAAAAVLLGEESPIDLPLCLVRHYEQNQWDLCSSFCHMLAITEADLAQLYLDSLHWATKQIRDSTH
jgi:EAL and modified HD-GYP domain-containing signal transduction protein